MERLEPDDAKVSCPVLRGGGGGNAASLPGVRSNPLRYNDPTGHCSGDPKDSKNTDRPCWDWINKINSKYKNIHIDPDNWTAEELEAVWNAIEDHVFIDKFSSANSITFYRKASPDSAPIGSIAGGETQQGIPGTYNIYIYNGAYEVDPGGNGKLPSSIDNFRGNVAHELAHVAVYEDPSIKESYEKARGMRFSHLGTKTAWAASSDQTSEHIALVVGAYEVDPSRLTYKYALFITVSWEDRWINSYVEAR